MSARWRALVAAAALGLASAMAMAGCASYQAARLYARGTEALDRGEPERAIRDLERAAELAPRASPIQNHLGLAYRSAGRHEEAVAAFERALELDCDNHAAASNLRAANAGAGGVP